MKSNKLSFDRMQVAKAIGGSFPVIVQRLDKTF